MFWPQAKMIYNWYINYVGIEQNGPSFKLFSIQCVFLYRLKENLKTYLRIWGDCFGQNHCIETKLYFAIWDIASLAHNISLWAQKLTLCQFLDPDNFKIGQFRFKCRFLVPIECIHNPKNVQKKFFFLLKKNLGPYLKFLPSEIV